MPAGYNALGWHFFWAELLAANPALESSQVSPQHFPSTRNKLYNAPLLVMALLPPKGLIAALLPLSFLWVFMACVSICERETLAMHPPTDLSCSTGISEIRHIPDCGGCPLSYFPTATTPERAKSILALDTLSSFAPLIPSICSSHPDVFSDRLDRLVFNGSPPLKLLSTLRI